MQTCRVTQQPWRDYEVQARDFFRTMGIAAEVGEVVRGARAEHRVDVVVRPRQLGWTHLWLVECKAVTRPVPKEKVLTFLQVVADAGADRGFLLAEAGFQPSAQHAAAHTNVTLTSLSGLHRMAEEELTNEAQTRPFDLEVFEHEDSGMGPDTDIVLRRRDGGPLEMPMSATLYGEGIQWDYELAQHDLSDEGRRAEICLYHFNTCQRTGVTVESGRSYRLVWRTPCGPIHGRVGVRPEK
jgi:hypothetical protein